MRHLLAVSSVVATVGFVAGLGAQHHGPAPQQHPSHMAVAHELDHTKATHRFQLDQDGGTIEVSVKDARDHVTLETIRQHLAAFGRDAHGPGHAMPAHDATRTHVRPAEHDEAHAGIAALSHLKEKISYTYSETDRGARVLLQTTDHQALTAIHAFLKSQIQHHRTGDSETIRKR